MTQLLAWGDYMYALGTDKAVYRYIYSGILFVSIQKFYRNIPYWYKSVKGCGDRRAGFTKYHQVVSGVPAKWHRNSVE